MWWLLGGKVLGEAVKKAERSWAEAQANNGAGAHERERIAALPEHERNMELQLSAMRTELEKLKKKTGEGEPASFLWVAASMALVGGYLISIRWWFFGACLLLMMAVFLVESYNQFTARRRIPVLKTEKTQLIKRLEAARKLRPLSKPAPSSIAKVVKPTAQSGSVATRSRAPARRTVPAVDRTPGGCPKCKRRPAYSTEEEMIERSFCDRCSLKISCTGCPVDTYLAILHRHPGIDAGGRCPACNPEVRRLKAEVAKIAELGENPYADREVGYERFPTGAPFLK